MTWDYTRGSSVAHPLRESTLDDLIFTSALKLHALVHQDCQCKPMETVMIANGLPSIKNFATTGIEAVKELRSALSLHQVLKTSGRIQLVTLQKDGLTTNCPGFDKIFSQHDDLRLDLTVIHKDACQHYKVEAMRAAIQSIVSGSIGTSPAHQLVSAMAQVAV